MSLRLKYHWLSGVVALCLVILIQNLMRNEISSESVTTTTSDSTPSQIVKDAPDLKDELSDEIIEQIVENQRKKIRKDMTDYEYPNGRYNISAGKLEDLTIEENGRPIRTVVVTTWRSGSTFLADIINAHPATFFSQEPLLDFETVQIRGPPLAKMALTNLRALLNCEYAKLDHYIEFLKNRLWPMSYNKDYWAQCRLHQGLCFKQEFFTAMCKLFPFQLTKLVRLKLGVARELLADEELAVRMVLLVRDPRGTFQSRKHCQWCKEFRDCSDPALLCADLAADYRVAVELKNKYPTRFTVIRYEDLSAEPYERAEEMSNFLGIGFHTEMKNFLDTHTKEDVGDQYTTYRNTKLTPYHWKTELKFEEVEEVQKSCAAAMEYWGYLPAVNHTHQREFHPVASYTLE